MGPAVIPTLLPLLDGHNETARHRAAGVLGRLGSAARAALPALARLLDSADDRDRWIAAEGVALIATPAEAVALLRPLFGRPGGAVRVLLRCAERFGAAALPWLPELLHLVATRDSDYYGARQVFPALSALAGHSPAVVEGLRELLADPDAIARANARAALDAIAAAT
jgi:HEAT repeat protein